MKIMKSVLLASAAIVLMSGSAMATQSNVATGTASATVIAPLTFTSQTALNFGAFVLQNPNVSSSIVASTGSTTNAKVVGVSGVPTNGVATFGLTGQPSQGYTVTLSSPTVTVGSLAVSVVGGTSRTVTSAGTDTFNVDGTLTIPGNTTAQTITGSYQVSANY